MLKNELEFLHIHDHGTGIYEAMNMWLHASEGEHVIFLNNDDFLW